MRNPSGVNYQYQEEDGTWPEGTPAKIRYLHRIPEVLVRVTNWWFKLIFGYNMFLPSLHDGYNRGWKEAMAQARREIGIAEGAELTPVFSGSAEELKRFVLANPDLAASINRSSPPGKLGQAKGEKDA
jgi:hypothetical protein